MLPCLPNHPGLACTTKCEAWFIHCPQALRTDVVLEDSLLNLLKVIMDNMGVQCPCMNHVQWGGPICWNPLSPLFQPPVNPILSHMEWWVTQFVLDDCIYPPMKVTLHLWEALLSWANQILHNHLTLSIIKPGLLRIGVKDRSLSIDALLECSPWDIEAVSSLMDKEDVIAQQCLLICCHCTLELHFFCLWSLSFDYCYCLCAYHCWWGDHQVATLISCVCWLLNLTENSMYCICIVSTQSTQQMCNEGPFTCLRVNKASSGPLLAIFSMGACVHGALASKLDVL